MCAMLIKDIPRGALDRMYLCEYHAYISTVVIVESVRQIIAKLCINCKRWLQIKMFLRQKKNKNGGEQNKKQILGPLHHHSIPVLLFMQEVLEITLNVYNDCLCLGMSSPPSNK